MPLEATELPSYKVTLPPTVAELFEIAVAAELVVTEEEGKRWTLTSKDPKEAVSTPGKPSIKTLRLL